MNIYPSYVEDILGEWLRYKVWSDFDRLNDGLWHNPFMIEQADFPKAREYLIDWGYKQDTEIKFFYPVLHSTSNYLKSITHYNSKNKLKYNVVVGNTFEIISDTNAPSQPFHIFSNKRSKFIYDKYRQLAIQSDLKLIHKFYFLLNIIRPIDPSGFSYNVKFLPYLHFYRNLFPSTSYLKPLIASDINVEEVLKLNLSKSVSFTIDLEIPNTSNNVYYVEIKTSYTIASDLTVCPSSNMWYVKDNWREFRNGWSTTCS